MNFFYKIQIQSKISPLESTADFSHSHVIKIKADSAIEAIFDPTSCLTKSYVLFGRHFHMFCVTVNQIEVTFWNWIHILVISFILPYETIEQTCWNSIENYIKLFIYQCFITFAIVVIVMKDWLDDYKPRTRPNPNRMEWSEMKWS